jgi:hypothetical protein
MKKTLLFLSLILIFSAVNAQNEKKLTKKSVKVEITDISGKTYSGLLWYADSSVISISNKAILPDTVNTFEIKDIKNINLTKRYLYGNRFVKVLGASTVAAIAVTTLSFLMGGESMIGPMLTFAIVEVIYVTPFSLAAGIIPYKRKIEISVEGNSSELLEKYKFLNRNKISDKP